MASPPNPAMTLAVTYEYLFYLSLSDRLWPPSRWKLERYYRGLVPRVPWTASYGLKFWIRLVPSSD
jgi:hypothetical protein